MSRSLDNDLLDYYRHYCELTIWFKKIVLHSDPNHYITIKDITLELIAERNRILSYIPKERRQVLRKQLNAITTSYYNKIKHWSINQKITIDMV